MVTQRSQKPRILVRSKELESIFDVSLAVAYGMALDEEAGRIVIDDNERVINIPHKKEKTND